MRTTRVSLKRMDVSSVKMVFSLGNLAGRMIGPVWRQARENCDGSCASPKVPDTPPRPCLADVTGDARYLGIAEGFDANLVVGADELPRGSDAANVVGVSRQCGQQQADS